ncbi:MAG: hypothetical protein ACRET5_07540, partial [Steroidobacteraceae bacterium]
FRGTPTPDDSDILSPPGEEPRLVAAAIDPNDGSMTPNPSSQTPMHAGTHAGGMSLPAGSFFGDVFTA